MNNICKFTQSTLFSPLLVATFVMESNESVMRSPVQLKNHRVLLIIQGHGTFYFHDQSLPFEAGDLIFGFEKELFRADPSKDTSYMYIDFNGGRGEELLSRFGINKANRRFERCDGLIPLWRDSLSRARDDTVDLATESILLFTFSRLCTSSSEQDSLVGKILKYTEENFRDPETSISCIAKNLSYNSKYLSHVFKSTMSMTYSEYLRNMRIRYAVTLFNEGIDSVKNVALLSGFSDPLYFSSTFKKIMGMSPRDYIASVSADVAEKS